MTLGIDANTVLLPIDMQRAFDAPPFPRRGNAALDRNGLALLGAWRRARLPIIHVRHDSVEPGSPLVPGLAGHAFRDGFEPAPGEALVAKSVNAAFIGTDLDLRLRRLGASRIVLFGLTADMCVSTTMRVGANLGYRMTIVGDACDCFELPDISGGTIAAETILAAHLATLAYEFGTVVQSAQVLAWCETRAAA